MEPHARDQARTLPVTYGPCAGLSVFTPKEDKEHCAEPMKAQSGSLLGRPQKHLHGFSIKHVQENGDMETEVGE